MLPYPPNIKINLSSNLEKIFVKPSQLDEVKKIEIQNYYGNGRFEYVSDEYIRTILINAWQAITITEMWEFLSEPIDNYTYSEDNRINIIINKMVELGYDGHSGSSFGCIMRNMQYIAHNGEENFKNNYYLNNIKK